MTGAECYTLQLQRLDVQLQRTRTTVFVLSIVCALLLISTIVTWTLRQQALEDQRATAAAAVSLIGELEEVRAIAERVAIALDIEEETSPDTAAAAQRFVQGIWEEAEAEPRP